MQVKLLRAATLIVSDLKRSESLYRDWLYYDTVESGVLAADLAVSWGAPASAGKPYVVMAPKSGAEIYLRFIEDEPHPDYEPLKTYGWAAIEICVEDVLKVNEAMLKSPFTIIGPPRELDGMPAIFPMQVQGPDGEIVYLTQIRDDLPMYDLPRATALIDRQFIHVCAVSDLKGALSWCEQTLGLSFGRDMAIVYTMLANAFGVSYDNKFTIATLTHDRDVFFEFDQLPPAAGPRPVWKHRLPPGVAISTITLPDFNERVRAHSNWLITPPAPRQGAIYKGRRAATMRGPDGILFELVEI
jgi:catechol 2,3-dioxygenase-like lactoylglutathione lyase family enzyme